MAITRTGKICSFCGEPGGPGTDLMLVGGLGAQICVPCLDQLHELVHDDEAHAPHRGASPWDRMSDGELLATLPRILGSAEQNLAFAHEWVELLRERNVSWAEIGRALGVTRQAAWERFSRKTSTAASTA